MASAFLAPQPLPSPILSHSRLPCEVKSRNLRGAMSRPRTAPSKSSEKTFQVQQQPTMPSFPKRPGLGALLARRPSTSAGTAKTTTTSAFLRQAGGSTSTSTPSAPLLSSTQASGFVSTIQEPTTSQSWSPKVTFAFANRKISEGSAALSSEGDHLLTGLRCKGTTMLQGVRYALNTALVQLASVESPSADGSYSHVASKPSSGSSTMYRRQSGVSIASSRIGDSSAAFPWTPLSPPVVLPCPVPSYSPTCSNSSNGSSSDEQRSVAGSPMSSSRPLLSPDARFASQRGLKKHGLATAAAASSSPSPASALSPWAPTSLPASPLSSASSGARSADGGSGQSFSLSEASNNGRSASHQEDSHQQSGQGQDFWVNEDGQMVFRILPLHGLHGPSDADIGLEHQQKHGGYAQAEEIDSCPISPGCPLRRDQQPLQQVIEHPDGSVVPEDPLWPSLLPATLSNDNPSGVPSRARVTFGPLQLHKPLPPVTGRGGLRKKASYPSFGKSDAKVSRALSLEQGSRTKLSPDDTLFNFAATKQFGDSQAVAQGLLHHLQARSGLPSPIHTPVLRRGRSDPGAETSWPSRAQRAFSPQRACSLEARGSDDTAPAVPAKSSPSSLAFQSHRLHNKPERPLRPILQRSQSSRDLRAAAHAPHCQLLQAVSQTRCDIRQVYRHQQASSSPARIEPIARNQRPASTVRPNTSPSLSPTELKNSRSLLSIRSGSFSALSPVEEQAELQELAKTQDDNSVISQTPGELSARIAHYLSRRDQLRPQPLVLAPLRHHASFESELQSASNTTSPSFDLPSPFFANTLPKEDSTGQVTMLKSHVPVSPVNSSPSSRRSSETDSGSPGLSHRRRSPNLRRVQIESQPGFYDPRVVLPVDESAAPVAPLRELCFDQSLTTGVAQRHEVEEKQVTSFRSASADFGKRQPGAPAWNVAYLPANTDSLGHVSLHSRKLSVSTNFQMPSSNADSDCDYDSDTSQPLQRPSYHKRSSFSQYKKGDDLPGAKARRVLGLNKNAGWEIGEDASDGEDHEARTAEGSERKLFRMKRRPRASLEGSEHSKALAKLFGHKHSSPALHGLSSPEGREASDARRQRPSLSSLLGSNHSFMATEGSTHPWSLPSSRKPSFAPSESSLGPIVATKTSGSFSSGTRPSTSKSVSSERIPLVGLFGTIPARSTINAQMGCMTAKGYGTTFSTASYKGDSVASGSTTSLPLPQPAGQISEDDTVTSTPPPVPLKSTITGAKRDLSSTPACNDVSSTTSRIDTYLRRFKPGHAPSFVTRPYQRNQSLPSPTLPRHTLSSAPTSPSGVAAPPPASPSAHVGVRDLMLWERTLENSQRDASWHSMIEHRPRARQASVGERTPAASQYASPFVGRGAVGGPLQKVFLLDTPKKNERDGPVTSSATPSTISSASPASTLWTPETNASRSRVLSPGTSVYDSELEDQPAVDEELLTSGSGIQAKPSGGSNTYTDPMRYISDDDNSPTLGRMALLPEQEAGYSSSEEGVEMLEESTDGGEDARARLAQAKALGSPVRTRPLSISKSATGGRSRSESAPMVSFWSVDSVRKLESSDAALHLLSRSLVCQDIVASLSSDSSLSSSEASSKRTSASSAGSGSSGKSDDAAANNAPPRSSKAPLHSSILPPKSPSSGPPTPPTREEVPTDAFPIDETECDFLDWAEEQGRGGALEVPLGFDLGFSLESSFRLFDASTSCASAALLGNEEEDQEEGVEEQAAKMQRSKSAPAASGGVGMSPAAPLPRDNLARRTSPVVSCDPDLFSDWQGGAADSPKGSEADADVGRVRSAGEKGGLLLILPPSASSAVFKIGPSSQHAPLQQHHNTHSEVLLNHQLEGFGFHAPREQEQEREREGEKEKEKTRSDRS